MTPSLAHRSGAEAESCYGHEIEHPGGMIESERQYCIGLCRVDLRLIDEVNEADFSNLLNVGIEGNYYLSCGSVYRCKLFALKPLISKNIHYPNCSQ